MAISAFDTQRLVSHRGASVGQSLWLVTRRASEFLVISIQLESRVLLMVKRQLVKAVTVDMTLRAFHIFGWSKLTDVRIPVTSLAVSAGSLGEDSVKWVRCGRPGVAVGALRLRVSAAKFVSRPKRVIKSNGADLLKAFRGVAPSATGISVNDRRQVWLVKLAIMNIDVTCTALGRGPMKQAWFGESGIR